jgi:hypothetical protein
MLSFATLHLSDLTKGVKYMIEENSVHVNELIFIGNFNGYQQHNEEKYLSWTNILYFSKMVGDELITPNQVEEMRMSVLSPFGRKYYKLVSSKEKIQSAMETRAVNLILQQLIGDSTFTY